MDLATFNHVRAQLDFRKRIDLLVVRLLFAGALFAGILTGLATLGIAGKVIAAVLLPVLFFNGFGLMHEAVHGALAQDRWVNDAVGVLGGAFCFLPYLPWKLMHLEHHQWAGNVERDPVNKLRKDYDPKNVVKNQILSAIWRSWLPILAFLQHTVFWMYPLQQWKTLNLDVRNKIVYAASYLFPATLYVGLVLRWPTAFTLVNFAPGIFCYLVLVEFVNLPHHLDLPTYRDKTRLPIMDQHLIARSAVYSKPFAQWVLLNFNLHSEHHLFPTLPWHELQKARTLVKPVLGDSYNETQGNSWLRKHRNAPLGDLLAPKDDPASKSQSAVA